MTYIVELPQAVDPRLAPDVCILVNVSGETRMLSGDADRDEQWSAARSCNKKAN